MVKPHFTEPEDHGPPMTEARLRTMIKRELEQCFGGWWVVIHGGPFQERFIPDILGLCKGHFFALEVKLPERQKSLTPGQAHRLNFINAHGGHARMVTSVDVAVEFVAASLPS